MSVLQKLGVQSKPLRDAVLRLVTPRKASQTNGGDLPYASRAKYVLEQAMAEARAFDHSYVGTEHLLLGLLREGKGLAAAALAEAGVTLDAARAETLNILVGGTPTPKPDVGPMKHLSGSGRRIREIVAAAYDIATKRGSTELSAAHLAIALLHHDGGFANAVLERLQFDADAALAQLDAMAPRGAEPVGGDQIVRPTAEAIQVIQAMEELARQSRGAVAGSQHLLLALLRISDVEGVFASHHAGLAEVTREIKRMTG
jgi:ATP-dependent Clp protease ATP-binding subunit ClpA